jgi:hypothetical protein
MTGGPIFLLSSSFFYLVTQTSFYYGRRAEGIYQLGQFATVPVHTIRSRHFSETSPGSVEIAG